MLDKLEKIVQRCVCCGFCNSVCPVYNELEIESVSARGKLAIIVELIKGNIKPSKRLKQILSLCLCCNTCGNNCPNNIPVSEIIAIYRSRLKSNIVEDIIFDKFLPSSNSLFNLSMSILGLIQDKFGNLKKSNVSTKIDLPFLNSFSDRLIPHITDRFFSRNIDEFNYSNNEKYRVLFFPGCLVNYFYPELGNKIVEFLTKHQTTVIVPYNLKCCGLPSYISGKISSFIELVKFNFNILNNYKYDYILTLCPSCGTILKDMHYVDEVKSSDISKKVLDLSEFIIKIYKNEINLKPLKGVVTYHSSCHLKNIQKVVNEPLYILRQYDNFTLPLFDQCCGFGGFFSFKHYDISIKIALKRVESIKQIKASTLIVSCPACMIHLRDGIQKSSLDIDIKHIVELL